MLPTSFRHWNLTISVLALSILAAFTGCSKESISVVETPVLVVSPDTLVFDQVSIGDMQTLSFSIANEGSGTLVITGTRLSFDTPSRDFEVEEFDGTRLGAGEARTVTVTYRPSDEIRDTGRIVIESNSSRATNATVTLTALDQAASIVATPPELTLFAAGAGDRVSGSVTLTNLGSRAFQISEVFKAANLPQFELMYDETLLPGALGPNQSVDIEVIYAPTRGGVDTEQIVLTCDASNCGGGTYTVPINGITDSPRLRVSPGDVAFGAVALNPSPAPTRTVTARNEGQGRLQIQSIAWAFSPTFTGEFAIESVAGEPYDENRGEPWELDSDEEIEIVLSYSPTDATPDVETLVFRSNDAALPQQTVRVGGTLAAPRLEVFPDEIEFPLTAISLSTTREVTIRNAGSEPLDLDPLRTLGGGFADGAFTLVNGDALPEQLGSGEDFTLQIRFAPTIPEVNYAGTVYVIPLNDPATNEARVNVSARSAREPECELRPIPSTLNFGTVPRGTRAEQIGRVRNTGSGPCEITGVTKQSSFFGAIFSDYFELEDTAPRPPFTLEPGDEFEVRVSYFPLRVTDISETFGDAGSIEVRARDPYDTSRRITCGATPPLFSGVTRDCGINLQARSAVAEIAAIPGIVDFGLVTLGCNSQTETIRVYNTGGADVSVSNVEFEDCSAEFAMSGLPVFPRTISRGESFAFQVRYRPSAEGRDDCRVVITSDSGETTRLVVPIGGEGVTYTRTVDRFEQLTGRKVDILFVIDNSGSMGDVQSNLSRNFQAFTNAAQTWGSDFQIAIVTTQTEGTIPDPAGGSRQPGEFLGNPRIITPRTPNVATVLSSRLQVGVSNSMESAIERGLESARLALTDPNITSTARTCTADDECDGYSCVANADGTERRCGGYNRSFLRDDASLELVFVSDEEDQSRAELSFYIDLFKSIKGFRNTSLLHASSIVGPDRGCSTSSGSADPGRRYMEVSRATGGEVASICDSDFSRALTDIGNRAFGLRIEFFLSRAADASTVQVFDLNNCTASATRTPRTAGWTFDVSTNSVVFTESTAPQPGECFEVEYEAACF